MNRNKGTAKERHLLMVVNEDRFFLSHRLAVAQGALRNGWRVTVAAASTGRDEEVRSHGIEFIPLVIDPQGMRPDREIRSIIQLAGIYRAYPDSLIHQVGVKLILQGQIALSLCRRHRGGVVNAYSGLGRIFARPESAKARLILHLLRIFHLRRDCVSIFQNHDDEKIIIEGKAADKWHSIYIKGSGVDLDRFPTGGAAAGLKGSRSKNTAECGNLNRAGGERLRIIFTGRLSRSKGVPDLIAAAEKLRPDWEDRAEILICGRPAGGADGITAEEMRKQADGKYIKWFGERDDIPELLMQSDIMVFPSSYREGVPLSLIEASAAALPIVTCDSVGCRDTVADGENGYLVRTHDVKGLARRMEELLGNPELRLRMGALSRKRAEREYDIRNVVSRHLEIYDSLHPR